MSKVVDFNKTVFENVSANRQVIDVMISLGFDEITKPGRLESVGSVVTLNMGSEMRGVPLDKMVAAFEAAGFEVVGAGDEGSEGAAVGHAPAEHAAAGEATGNAPVAGASDAEPAAEREAGESGPVSADDRQAVLEQLVRRLSGGEDLESVRKDFVRDFASVSAHEIAQAEQNLISSGMPVREVQQLCDVHSALVHGRTDEECSVLAEADGLPAAHPASVLKRENDALV